MKLAIKRFLIIFFSAGLIFGCASTVTIGDNHEDDKTDIIKDDDDTTTDGDDVIIDPEPPVYIPKTECVSPEQGIFVLPNLLIFEKLLAGNSATLSFEVGNFGDKAVVLEGAYVSATREGMPVISPFSIEGVETSQTLEPPDPNVEFSPGVGVVTGNRVTVTVTFEPSQVGDYRGVILLHFEGLPDYDVHLTGSALNSIPTRTVSSCGELSENGATYTLDPPGEITEISAPGRCIYITGSNITFDMNGNTIRYGGNGANEQYGIHIYGANTVVKNGKVLQDTGAGDDSHGIMMNGPSTNTIIEYMEVYVSSHDSKNITAPYHAGLLDFRNNTLDSDVVTITSRHQWDGKVISTVPAVGNADTLARYGVHDNVIDGGAQAGIVISGDGSQVYGNIIKQNAYWTNDFSVGLKDHLGIGKGIEVFDNVMEPYSGRGMHILFKNNLVHHNLIRVKELSQNLNAGGNCQPGGTYGIQIEDSGIGTTGNLIYANHVVAIADECQAGGALRISGIGTDLDAEDFIAENEVNSNNAICNNIFEARRAEGTAEDANSMELAATSLDAGFLIKGNVIKADSNVFAITYDGAPNGAIFERNTLRKGDNLASNFRTIFSDSSSLETDRVEELYFLDNIIEDDIDFTNVSWKTDVLGQFFLGWILNVNVEDSSGNPIPNAYIQIRDAGGELVENAFYMSPTELNTFTTDENGFARIPVPEFIWTKPIGTSASASGLMEGLNPFTFFVDDGGGYVEIPGTYSVTGLDQELILIFP